MELLSFLWNSLWYMFTGESSAEKIPTAIVQDDIFSSLRDFNEKPEASKEQEISLAAGMPKTLEAMINYGAQYTPSQADIDAMIRQYDPSYKSAELHEDICETLNLNG